MLPYYGYGEVAGGRIPVRVEALEHHHFDFNPNPCIFAKPRRPLG